MAGAGRAGRGAVAPGGGRSGNVASAENDPVPLVESGGAGVDRDQPLIPHARTRRRQIRPNASGNRWPCAADVSEYSGTFPATGEGIVAVRHYARAVAVAVAVARRAGSSWSGGEDGELAHSYGLMIIEGLPTGGAATWRKTPMVAGPLSSNVREAVGGIKDEPVADQTPPLSVTRRPGGYPVVDGAGHAAVQDADQPIGQCTQGISLGQRTDTTGSRRRRVPRQEAQPLGINFGRLRPAARRIGRVRSAALPTVIRVCCGTHEYLLGAIPARPLGSLSRGNPVVIPEAKAHVTSRRCAWGRLARLAPMLLALALASSACISHGGRGSAAHASKVTQLRSVSELQDRFNQDSGKVRLILIISPT